MKKLLLLLLTPFISFSQDLNISGIQTIQSGTYSNVSASNGSEITINGNVTFGNYNGNQSKVKITIPYGSQLKINSSLNFNGSLSVIVNGELETSNQEFQNSGSGNSLTGSGKVKVNGDLQLSSSVSTIDFTGEITVTNFTNFHNGSFNLSNCGKLITGGLNVNKANVLSGKGFVQVLNNLNLNANLSTSDQILFCYSGNINDASKLGSVARSCTNSCTTPPLNLKYSDLKVTKISNKKYVLTFRVLENTNVKEARLKFSIDAKNWTVIRVIQSKEFLVGKVYRAEFSILN